MSDPRPEQAFRRLGDAIEEHGWHSERLVAEWSEGQALPDLLVGEPGEPCHCRDREVLEDYRVSPVSRVGDSASATVASHAGDYRVTLYGYRARSVEVRTPVDPPETRNLAEMCETILSAPWRQDQ